MKCHGGAAYEAWFGGRAGLILTAEVSGVQPTGTVTFRDGPTPIAGCSDVILINIDGRRLATCTTSSLSAGTHSLSGSYPGDSRHLSSTGNLSQRINARPALNQPSDLVLFEDQASAPVVLSLTDAETAAASLSLATGSSNQALVSDAMLSAGVSGTGSTRNLVITPAPDRSGGATITLGVTDGDGATTSRSFLLNVIPVNDAPTLSLSGNQYHPAGSSGAFQVAGFASGDPGPFETGQTLSYSVLPLNNAQTLVTGAAIDASGRLSYQLNGSSGGALFAVVARDDGGTSNGGSDRSAPRLFRVLVGNGANIALQIARIFHEPLKIATFVPTGRSCGLRRPDLAAFGMFFRNSDAM
ncbi:Ig-like domain repeat protein, partial [Pseudomarimonas arenosa]|nr:Ig-like domain repeat protein [Pseudomarimonas arenosa]